MKIKHTIILFSLTLFVFSSCKKEGPAGPAGKDGKDGNANVHSQIFTVSSWSYSSPSYYADLTYSEITQDIVNSGAVLVYWSNGSGGYAQLPVTIYPSSSYSETLQTISYTGGVRIYITDSDLTAPIQPATQVFKVVTLSRSARQAHPGLNYNNYDDVKNAFQLHD